MANLSNAACEKMAEDLFVTYRSDRFREQTRVDSLPQVRLEKGIVINEAVFIPKNAVIYIQEKPAK